MKVQTTQSTEITEEEQTKLLILIATERAHSALAADVVPLYNRITGEMPDKIIFKKAMHIVNTEYLRNDVRVKPNTRGRPIRDWTGHQQGTLTVIGPTPYVNRHKWVQWWCECDCGKTCVKNNFILKQGVQHCSRTCKCSYKQTKPNSVAIRDNPREYKAWLWMVAEADRKKIPVHKPWRNSFDEFFDYIGPAPDKQRVIVCRLGRDEGYIPDKTVWPEKGEQITLDNVVHVSLEKAEQIIEQVTKQKSAVGDLVWEP